MYYKRDLQKGSKTASKGSASHAEEESEAKQRLFSFSQGTHQPAKNNWRYSHIWLLEGANHQEPHEELLSWEGSPGLQLQQPC